MSSLEFNYTTGYTLKESGQFVALYSPESDLVNLDTGHVYRVMNSQDYIVKQEFNSKGLPVVHSKEHLEYLKGKVEDDTAWFACTGEIYSIGTTKPPYYKFSH